MEFVSNRDRNVLKKYIKAEEIRQSKQQNSSLISKRNSYQRHLQLQTSDRIEKLQFQLQNQLKFKKAKEVYNQRRKAFQRTEDSALLNIKIKQKLDEQDAKLIRKLKPRGPKADPLPYLKKVRQKLNDTIKRFEKIQQAKFKAIEVKAPTLTSKVQLRLVSRTPQPFGGKSINNKSLVKLSSVEL